MGSTEVRWKKQKSFHHPREYFISCCKAKGKRCSHTSHLARVTLVPVTQTAHHTMFTYIGPFIPKLCSSTEDYFLDDDYGKWIKRQSKGRKHWTKLRVHSFFCVTGVKTMVSDDLPSLKLNMKNCIGVRALLTHQPITYALVFPLVTLRAGSNSTLSRTSWISSLSRWTHQ